MSSRLRKPPFRFARLFYLGYRGFVRLVTVPMRYLREGPVKQGLRAGLLRFQHSLPTELAVNRGDTVVQVGTPNPRTMLRFLRAVGPAGRLVIVEAMPENQARLQDTIDRDRLDNVMLIRAAACNENRDGELAVSPFWGDHKIPLPQVTMDNDLKPENDEMSLIPVEFVRLDDALAKIGIDALDYLSVTVNGAEVEVLKGAAEVLRRSGRGTRVYAKGHALDELGRPIHVQSQSVMSELGYRTRITKGEPSSTLDKSWLWRHGDLYAWKA